MASRTRQWFDFAMLYTLLLLAKPVPRGVLLAIGRGLGTFAWRVVRYRRGVVLDNLSHAFPDRRDPRDLDALALSFFRNLGMTLMEFLAFPRMKREDFLSLVRIQGEEHLRAAAEGGRGALFVTGHFGNWELLAARIAAEGYPATAMAKTQANRRVDRLQNGIRRRAGIGILRTGSGVKEMMKVLRRGEMIGLVADQDAGSEGYFMDFLGRPASVFKGPAYFAWRLQVPLLTVFIYREAGGRHRIVVDPPVMPDSRWGEEEAVARLTELHVKRLEDAVRQAPDHYFWVHRRWKTRPPA